MEKLSQLLTQEKLTATISYPKEVDKKSLTKTQKIAAKLFGAFLIRKEQLVRGREYAEIYIVWCRKDKIYFEDYPHGYDKEFRCPKCEQKVSNLEKDNSLLATHRIRLIYFQ